MRKIFLTILATIALNANAATFNETTNPDLDNVFLDGGHASFDTTTELEWLSFQNDGTAYTQGYSINEAASWYANQGWVLASEAQVVGLFDLFFTDFGFAAGSDGTQTINSEDPSNSLIQSRNSWLLSFGHNANIADDGTVTFPNNLLYSAGMYKNEEDGTFGVAGIKIGITDSGDDLFTTFYGSEFGIDGFDGDTAYSNLGVFMVRSDRGLCSPDNPECGPVVPIPAAVWLFASGLLGLVAVARRKA